jgi:hypothetical protein
VVNWAAVGAGIVIAVGMLVVMGGWAYRMYRRRLTKQKYAFQRLLDERDVLLEDKEREVRSDMMIFTRVTCSFVTVQVEGSWRIDLGELSDQKYVHGERKTVRVMLCDGVCVGGRGRPCCQ